MSSSQPLIRIVSGGQTGVDRAALDVAIFLSIPHGGWCPKGRRAEDGKIPQQYQLRETESINYAIRTRKNVVESDGTLILYRNSITKGTDLTRRHAESEGRPLNLIDLEGLPEWEEAVFDQKVHAVRSWIESENIAVLNVAGPRESTNQGIGSDAGRFLLKLLGSNSD